MRDASQRPAYQPWLHGYACLLVGATLLLICAGGQVKSHEAGLSVPDWPTTFGQNMFTYPPSKWTGGVLWEHSHRLIASSVGFLTIGLTVWLWIAERRRWLCWLGTAALAAVIVQGVLGGLTVIYKLPAPISVAHGMLAQAFFCIVIGVAVFTSRFWLTPVAGASASAGGREVRRLAAACIVVVFGQLLFGAMMRHTEAGLAVPDFPRAYEQWWPALDTPSVEQYNSLRYSEYGLPPVTREQIVFHLLHRVGAIVVCAVVVATAAVVLSRFGRVPQLATPAIWLLTLTAIQAMLGAAVVWSVRAPILATLHVACGAAVLGECVVLALRSRRQFPAGGRDELAAMSPAAAVA